MKTSVEESTKKKAKYISLSYESLLIKNRTRDRKIKVWMYKQICSPMIGVTSWAILIEVYWNGDVLPKETSHFPNVLQAVGTTTYLEAQNVVFEFISS